MLNLPLINLFQFKNQYFVDFRLYKTNLIGTKRFSKIILKTAHPDSDKKIPYGELFKI